MTLKRFIPYVHIQDDHSKISREQFIVVDRATPDHAWQGAAFWGLVTAATCCCLYYAFSGECDPGLSILAALAGAAGLTTIVEALGAEAG